MSISYKVLTTCPETGASPGVTGNRHGTVETPAFMPVGTQGTAKRSPLRSWRNADRHDLGNCYHLYLRPGIEVIARAGACTS